MIICNRALFIYLFFTFFYCRRHGQRTVADHPTDAAETGQTDWLVFDIELPARRRTTGTHKVPQMARSAEQDDRPDLVSI